MRLNPDEQAINADLWPEFTKLSRGIQSPNRSASLEAFDLWHMTFKGVCLKHKRPDLYDESRWAELRTIHTKEV